jgi:type 2 lantibiotic biosynthesis protein LanM
MEQMDIPYFGTASDTDSLILGLEQPIEHYFQESSYSKVIWRLQKLNEPDLAQQVEFIKMPFYARVAQASEIEEVDTSNSLATEYIDFSPATPLTDEQLLCKAQTIAQGIQERAIRGSDGSASWIGLVKPYRFKVMDDSLYSGNCGIAMFLAALDNVTGTSQFRNMALGALQSVQKTLRTSDVEFIQKFVQRIGIGGSSGLGAIIYSFVRISQFLQEAALLEDAQLAANLIVPESIAADKNLDIIHGSAGAILGLLALYNKTGDLTVLDKAVLCGQHLLEHRVSVNNYPKTWNTLDVDKETLTGFAHGATGIAYALVRLYAVTRDNAYLKAACEGIAYERNVFLLDLAANWPNFCTLEPSGQPSFKFVKWCHGAPGIGLARLGGLSILETDEIHQDIELALQTTQKYGLQGVDHLCCGSFGRIELLVVAAQKLSRPDLLETANQWAAWMIEQAEKNGTYQLFPNLPNRDFSAFNPSFFRGTAGIGYELLRLAYPEILPSVLLWE